MRSYLRSMLIGLAGFVLGGAAVYAFQSRGVPPEYGRASYHSDKPIVSALQLPKNDESAPQNQATAQARTEEEAEDAFLGQDPFTAMRKMREQMEKEMRAGVGAGMGFDMESGGAEITAKEDAKSVSYEIKDVVGGTLNTQVSNGMLTVSGESKQIHGSISMQSSFQRSFSLPPNVDAAKMETISEKDKVVLRFPKRG
jgi:HSP20 family molecular chaperone IbpA